MKFMQLILWPGGAYTDYTCATTVTIMIPYYDSFHESQLYRLIMAKPNEPKTHFEGKKALKTLFHNKETLPWKKSTKNTCFFFKNTCWEDWFKKLKLKWESNNVMISMYILSFEERIPWFKRMVIIAHYFIIYVGASLTMNWMHGTFYVKDPVLFLFFPITTPWNLI